MLLVRTLFDLPRGDDVFDPVTLLADATVNFDLFGYYGLSLWGTSEIWTLDRVLGEKARKARYTALFTAGDLRERGLGLVASGRTPHYDTYVGRINGRAYGPTLVTAASAEELIDRFLSATYTVVENHLFEQDPG